MSGGGEDSKKRGDGYVVVIQLVMFLSLAALFSPQSAAIYLLCLLRWWLELVRRGCKGCAAGLRLVNLGWPEQELVSPETVIPGEQRHLYRNGELGHYEENHYSNKSVRNWSTQRYDIAQDYSCGKKDSKSNAGNLGEYKIVMFSSVCSRTWCAKG